MKDFANRTITDEDDEDYQDWLMDQYGIDEEQKKEVKKLFPTSKKGGKLKKPLKKKDPPKKKDKKETKETKKTNEAKDAKV